MQFRTWIRGRARWLAGALVLTSLTASCRTAPQAPGSPVPREAPLHLSPLVDLVAAGGLRWVLDVKPRALLADPACLAAVAELTTDADRAWLAGSREQWGVDLREADELVAAGYEHSTLFLALAVVEPVRVEAVFGRRVAEVERRAIDRSGIDPRTTLTRLSGGLGKTRETVVIFGRQAVGLVEGDDLPLRAAELFAADKLKRARPAWDSPSLRQVSELLGEAPVRAAAPGPFVSEWATGLGGLLLEAAGVGVALRTEAETVRVDVVVIGPWGDRAAAAAEHLRKRYGAIAESGLGKLLGLNDPASEVTSSAEPGSIGLRVRFHTRPLLRGLRDATTGGLRDIMSSPFLSAP